MKKKMGKVWMKQKERGRGWVKFQRDGPLVDLGKSEVILVVEDFKRLNNFTSKQTFKYS